MNKVKYSYITEEKLSEYYLNNFGKWKTKEYDKESRKIIFLNIFFIFFIVAFFPLTCRPTWNFIEESFHNTTFFMFAAWYFLVICSLNLVKNILIEKKFHSHEQKSKEGYAKSKIEEYRKLLQFEKILATNESVRISTDRYETITAEWQDINGIWVKEEINHRAFCRDILTKDGLDFSWIDRKINEVLKEHGFPEILPDIASNEKEMY